MILFIGASLFCLHVYVCHLRRHTNTKLKTQRKKAHKPNAIIYFQMRKMNRFNVDLLIKITQIEIVAVQFAHLFLCRVKKSSLLVNVSHKIRMFIH